MPQPSEKTRSWKFPCDVEPLTGHIKSISGDESIKQSLYILLMTKKGERVMRPDYGCSISQYAFETVNYSLLAQLEHEIKSAIKLYEPRVNDVTVKFEENGEQISTTETLKILIEYNVIKTGRHDSMELDTSELI